VSTLTLTASPNSVTAGVRLMLWDPGPASWSLVAETDALAVGVGLPFTVPGGTAIVLPPAEVFAVPAGTVGGSQVEPGVDAPATPGAHYDPRAPDSPIYTPAGLALRGPSPTPAPTVLTCFVYLIDRKAGVYTFTVT
jgi:hypothetical protein